MLRRGLLKISPFIATVFPPLLSKATEKNDASAKDFNYGMHKVGLIGGIGPESTIPYYHGIVYGVQKQSPNKVFPKLTVESLNVFDVLNLSSKKDYDALEAYLMDGIKNLVASRVDAVAMTGNTPHVILDRLQAKCPVPIISIVQTTCDEAAHRNYKKVALLGTISTMNAKFFHEPFEKAGIEVIVPDQADREYINDKIGSELELGVVKPETREQFLKIIDKLQKEQGAQAIILGCTELPLLFKGQSVNFPCLDTMDIHIQALINFILNK